jgi:hypothetical protein
MNQKGRGRKRSWPNFKYLTILVIAWRDLGNPQKYQSDGFGTRFQARVSGLRNKWLTATFSLKRFWRNANVLHAKENSLVSSWQNVSHKRGARSWAGYFVSLVLLWTETLKVRDNMENLSADGRIILKGCWCVTCENADSSYLANQRCQWLNVWKR